MLAAGTGTRIAGGLTPCEVLHMVRAIASEGLAGVVIVEIAPPDSFANIASILSATIIREALGALVVNGKLGKRPETPAPSRLP